jgi:hypothetical protein
VGQLTSDCWDDSQLVAVVEHVLEFITNSLTPHHRRVGSPSEVDRFSRPTLTVQLPERDSVWEIEERAIALRPPAAVLFGGEFLVDLRVLVKILTTEEPDEILPRLLGGQLIGHLGWLAFSGYTYSSLWGSWS